MRDKLYSRIKQDIIMILSMEALLVKTGKLGFYII